MKHLLKWLGAALLALILIVTTPILAVETMCRGDTLPQTPPQYVTENTRPEARTYMVYPEWHIVYAYEGYAEALKTGHPHNFPYLQAITGFWTSLCGLTEQADALGEAGFNSKVTIYTIGASFTLEMLFKAAYEETIGRIFTLFAPSPQDTVEATMALDYATFLQQVPWYKYDFPKWSETLWQAEPVEIRGWERRLALGLEWGAKTQYAKLIAGAAAGLGADQLTMQIALKGPVPDLADITILSQDGDITIAEVPRYRIFTKLARAIAENGATFVGIAGNDDILVSLILEQGDFYAASGHNLISRTARVGFPQDRLLIATKVSDLHKVFLDYPNTPVTVEHIYDY
ncbi:MAG: hypothetical protein AAF340_03130 [Pseudomonadota bacterium]